MAATYTIVAQYPDVDTSGGVVARDVMAVVTRTDAHGVEFVRRYPRAQFSESIAQADALGFTIVFEELFKIPGVDAVVFGERQNAANQLEDYITVYYTSTSGDSSNFVEIPFRRLTQNFVAARVSAGRAILDANEAA